jgi:hypothetical protein
MRILCSFRSWVRRPLAGAALVLSLVGCNRDTVRVQLYSHPPDSPGAGHLEITAQVAGPQSKLNYRWFSISGSCSPQISTTPTTQFRFADGGTRDRVSVEVWRNDKLVGQSSIDVKLDEVQARLAAVDKLPPDLNIEITSIPPYEPKGGPDTHAEIAGTVGGKPGPDYSVVLYARASDIWYIQPTAYAAHAIRPDNTWTSWTHTGSSYAALLVRPGFEPLPRLDVLPNVGGYVVARTLVDGRR